MAVPPDPAQPGSIPAWQLYAWGWQAYAEDVLMQRVETAKCLAHLREVKIIK